MAARFFIRHESTLDVRGIALSLLLSAALSDCACAGPSDPPPPSTPREFFNDGTQKLRDGKLRESEALLESALASQQERLEQPALYNLGHVRFGQGKEELKKSPSAAPTLARGQTATQHGEEAIGLVDEALRSNDLQKMVAAYLRGRGARKELKAATEAVRQALGAHAAALGKWQRALGDFRSAVELNNADADARANADVVDRNIAKLVDVIRAMQQCSGGMKGMSQELGEKLKQLKGRIPGGEMTPGGAGDEEEEDKFPFGPKPGQEEGPSRDGKEMPLTPEQAGWLLDGYKLGSDRRLPMAQDKEGQPRDRNRPTW
jgi:tetratricopeptide (TPR) repeat protein